MITASPLLLSSNTSAALLESTSAICYAVYRYGKEGRCVESILSITQVEISDRSNPEHKPEDPVLLFNLISPLTTD